MAPKPTRPTEKEPSGKVCTRVCIRIAYTLPAGLIPGSSVLAEDAVDLAAGVVDDADDALLLLLVRGVRGLRNGAHQLGHGGTQRGVVRVFVFEAVGDLLPGRGLDLVCGGAALVG